MIQQIDTWAIVKAAGGISIILISTISVLFFLFKERILDRWRADDERKIDQLRGAMEKNNLALQSLLNRSLPSCVTEERLRAVKEIWTFVVKTKAQLPPSIRMLHTIFSDNEINLDSILVLAQKSPKEFDASVSLTDRLSFSDYEHLRYLIPKKLWDIVYVFQMFVNRNWYLTAIGYRNRVYVHWKKDDHTIKFLKEILDEEEVDYILKLKFGSFETVVNLLEYKILNETHKILSGENETEDSLKVLNRINEHIANSAAAKIY